MGPLEWVKKQFFHLLPAFLFFFVAFNLLNITEGLAGKTDTIGFYSFFNVLLASAIVAKALILVDSLPWLDLFPKKPLIYNVIWKTWIYGIAALLFRLAFRLTPLLFKTKSWTLAYNEMGDEVHWILFYSIQGWYFILIFLFITIRELIHLIGNRKAREAFFGF